MIPEPAIPSRSEGAQDAVIQFMSEQNVIDVVDQASVTEAIDAVFRSMALEEARNFPVVRETLNYADAIFGFKSGFVRSGPLLGIKAGGLWPGNRDRGLPNHQSTIMLFDPENGGPQALVCGTYLTALRTAAASALSIKYLARPESSTLAIVGTGGQAEYQIRAALPHGRFERILVAGRTAANAAALVQKLDDLEQDCHVVSIEEACRGADVLITIALSFAPLVMSDWISAGTHVACMGTDTRGKQELDPALVGRALCFGDAPDQNARLGEYQHAVSAGLLEESQIVPLGKVMIGEHGGRSSAQDVTLFDSTGMGLQDLAAARLALDAGIAAGKFTALDQFGG